MILKYSSIFGHNKKESLKLIKIKWFGKILLPWLTVTNYYYGSISVLNELHLVSSGNKSHLISGGVTAVVHGCSFMHWTHGKKGVGGL